MISKKEKGDTDFNLFKLFNKKFIPRGHWFRRVCLRDVVEFALPATSLFASLNPGGEGGGTTFKYGPEEQLVETTGLIWFVCRQLEEEGEEETAMEPHIMSIQAAVGTSGVGGENNVG